MVDVDDARIASGAAEPVQLAEDLLLRLEHLRRALLHEGRARERIGEARGGAHPGHGRVRVRDQAVRRKLGKAFGHQRTCLLGDARDGIVERDLAAAAREHDGPGAADQPRSDDRNAFLHIHSVFLLSARSSLSICEAPVQVTAPRSSTTVRSESASARSR